jgi:hypothetical protein
VRTRKCGVDGIDSDLASIERARHNLAGSGVEERVSFNEHDAADAGLPAATTSSRSSRRCTTCRTWSTCAPREACSPSEAPCSSATSAPRTRSRLPPARSSASLLRLQHLPLPTGGHGWRGRGRHGHCDPRRNGPPLGEGGPLLDLRGAADRERLLALLPAAALTGQPRGSDEQRGCLARRARARDRPEWSLRRRMSGALLRS